MVKSDIIKLELMMSIKEVLVEETVAEIVDSKKVEITEIVIEVVAEFAVADKEFVEKAVAEKMFELAAEFAVVEFETECELTEPDATTAGGGFVGSLVVTCSC